jgi:hypothetical protein
MIKLALLYMTAAAALAAGTAGAQAANLIVNGGFEDGVYTSTIGGNTNTQVPVGWDSTAAFDLEPGFNNVSTNLPHSGSFDLSIGNFDYQPLATLTQTFSDVSGDSYTVDFWTFDGGGKRRRERILECLGWCARRDTQRHGSTSPLLGPGRTR